MGSDGFKNEEIYTTPPNSSCPRESQSSQEEKAFKLANKGELEQAKILYQDIIRKGTSDYKIYNNLGIVCKINQEQDESINLLKESLRLNPNQPNIQNTLGILLKVRNKLDEATNCFHAAITLSPNHPEAHNNLGITLKKKGLLCAAIASFKEAIHLKPNYPEAYYNLGNAFKEKGDLDNAISAYALSIKLKHNYAKAHNNLGNTFKEKGDLDAALSCYEQAILINPEYPQALTNLGTVLQERGKLDSAIAYHEKAIRLRSNYPDARWNLALTMLLSGDYTNGWTHYECRFDKKKPSQLIIYPQCSRREELTLQNKDQLLLIGEQGLGDTIQFIRYAITLQNKFTNILICTQPKLRTLIKASGIKASLLAPQEASKITEGYWAPLLSIPRHLKVTPSNPIITKPYLKSTNKLNREWKNKLTKHKRPVIGINWKGNRKDSQKTDRNFPIQPILQAAENINGTIISLQRKTKNNENRSPWQSKNLIEIQEEIHLLADSNSDTAFAEYAAVIANCDLVITTATTTCHLAAAMGVTTWVLLQKVPDWRWGIEGETSFWYPSMRLFRQENFGDWDDVFTNIANALNQKFSRKLHGP